MGYIKKKSQKQENRTAKEFGGKTTPASGAMWSAKGDVRTGRERTSEFSDSDYLIENKFTDKDFYKLERKIWEKIEKEAIRDNLRTPLLQVDIQDLSLVVLDYYTAMEMFAGFKVSYYLCSAKGGSFRLDKSIFSSDTIYDLTFLGKIGSYPQLRLALVTKDMFLEARD